MSSRALSWYVVVSLIVAGALAAVGVPGVVLWGYLAIAVVGLVLGIRDARATNIAFEQSVFARLAQQKTNELEGYRIRASAYPWFDEVELAQTVAMRKGVHPFGIFTTYNPYWSLSYRSLFQFALTDEAELEAIRTSLTATSNSDPWRASILKDLITAGYADWDSALRVELFDRHGRVYGV